MDIGVVYFFTDDGPDPVTFAKKAEDLGFDAIFVPEHTHWPTSRKTPYPDMYGGGDLPGFYLRTYDQTVVMSFMAAATSRIKMGTGISLLAQYDPIIKAKEIASLDVLSGGRVIFGTGYGWNQDEAESHGVIWKKRVTLVREKVAVMRALWNDEVASYEGDMVSLVPSWADPKPLQEGGPKVYLGGAGPTGMREAALWADGWYPVPPPDDPTMEKSIPKFHAICEEVGRDPQSIAIGVASAAPDPAVIEKLREQGVAIANLWCDPAAGEQGLRNLEAIGHLANK